MITTEAATNFHGQRDILPGLVGDDNQLRARVEREALRVRGAREREGDSVAACGVYPGSPNFA